MKEKKEEILNAHKFRRAIKEFQEERKISDDDFDFILETARLSPSSFGWEPWKFLVIQNGDLRKKITGSRLGSSEAAALCQSFCGSSGKKSS